MFRHTSSKNMPQYVFRRQESKFIIRNLKLKVNGRKFLLRNDEKIHEKLTYKRKVRQHKVFYVPKHIMSRMKTKDTVLASTFSSPPMGRDENVPKSFLLTEFSSDFDTYQKMSLTDVVALVICNWGWLGFIACIPMSFRRDICSTFTLWLLDPLANSHSKHHKSTSKYDRETF